MTNKVIKTKSKELVTKHDFFFETPLYELLDYKTIDEISLLFDGDVDAYSAKNTTDTTYIHEQVRSVAGCYVVTAVDAAGNESTFSNQVCNDNCPNYALPNVFTPNGDGINDTFRALDCPAFVKNVETKIYSRWEQLVFETNSEEDNNVFIDWNGENNNGTAMPAGMYFFQVKVIFNRLNPTDEVLILKGWVSLLRE